MGRDKNRGWEDVWMRRAGDDVCIPQRERDRMRDKEIDENETGE